MRYLIILLFINSLYGVGFWTLTNVTKANIYIANKVVYLKPETIQSITHKVKTTLEKNNIKTGLQDSPTLIISIEEIEEEETHYVYIKFDLGEEVKTYRKDSTQTYALTYTSSEFIDVDTSELDADIMESIDSLLSQFIEQYKDDI
ncbi:hypothetical protein [Sulfurimonas sp.]|jgi:ribosomal protein S13|uniref:hypothetical protein n=1 Tax=Sulfurimonas sp. TaxID=2022749 RepID=UPI0025D4DFA4|nr:hypothetical protein [Sulfurimonas sp.]MBT5935961.1 hypothetical protein [Sulfurimonas sp.]